MESLALRMRHLQAKSGGAAPLFEHLIDVCGQAREFLGIYTPQWPLGNGANLPRMLAYASLLHDFGKIHPVFQSALSGGPRFNNRHEILSLAFLDCLDLPENEAPWVAAAVATHHRGWLQLQDRFSEFSETNDLGRLVRGIPEPDAALLYEMLGIASNIFSELGWESFAAYHVLPVQRDYATSILRQMENVNRLAMQLRNEDRQLRPGPKPPRNWAPVVAGMHMRGWLLSADHLASFGRTSLRDVLRSRRDVDDLFPGFQWRDYQMAAGRHNGSGLLIAPTGSGKTEAALLWSAQQHERGAHGRVCMLLPYQTSLNAMQRRLIGRLAPNDLEKPEEWNKSVGLLHGRTSRAMYEAFLERGSAPGTAEPLARDANELARLFAAPVAVSTVFSLIRLLFATRGSERLFVSFSGARIVVDEIHAYTPETTAMTLAALRFIQQHLRAEVLFMSATVPSHLRRVLATTLNVGSVLPSPPWSPVPRHSLSLLPFHCHSAEAVQAIREAAGRGSVLVVVNQVRRAIALKRVLADEGLTLNLLHSRFTFADRANIEARISPVPGHVLVATQAVEVSLDLDFDVCFSELAPLESIAQRFGRCNRHGKATSTAPVAVFLRFPDGTREYLPYDEGHLSSVSVAIQGFNGSGPRDFHDADIDALLDASYPDTLRSALEDKIRDKTGRVQAAFLSQWKPFGLDSQDECLALEQQWEELFDGYEVLPESLLDEARSAVSRLGVARHFVPISSRQFRRLKYQGAIDWDDHLDCYVIHRPYGSEGLDI